MGKVVTRMRQAYRHDPAAAGFALGPGREIAPVDASNSSAVSALSGQSPPLQGDRPENPPPRRQTVVARADGARRRFRRYRHQPALHVFGRTERHRPRAADRARCARTGLADLLGADGDGVAQIYRLRPARRQRWRRRNPGAVVSGGVRPDRQRRQDPDSGPDRHHGSGAALWRRRHYAGDFRAFGNRGTEARHAGIRASRAAAHAGDPDRPVHDPASRDGEHRAGVRPGHDHLVRRARLARPHQYLGSTRNLARAQSGRRGRFRGRQSGHGVCGHGRRLPRADRRGSAVRRHGPCRADGHPQGLVRAGAAGTAVELFRPGRAGSHRSHRDRQSVLQIGAEVGAHPHGGVVRSRDHHRLTGAHLRRLLPDPAGDAARTLPACADRADVARRSRPRSTCRRPTGC